MQIATLPARQDCCGGHTDDVYEAFCEQLRTLGSCPDRERGARGGSSGSGPGGVPAGGIQQRGSGFPNPHGVGTLGFEKLLQMFL